MRLIIAVSCLAIFCYSAKAGVVSLNETEIAVTQHLGPGIVHAASDWISLDACMLPFMYENPACDEIECSADPLEGIESPVFLAQPLLAWRHAPYFVSVLPAATVFSVTYHDPYANQASSGYPKLYYWTEGSSLVRSCSLTGGPQEYALSLELPAGTYGYCYAVKNDQMSEEFSLPVSSLVVSGSPVLPVSAGIADHAVVANAVLDLSWQGSDDSGTTYRLMLGMLPSSLPVVYEGTRPSCRLTQLEPSAQYYWQVDAVNSVGVLSRSPLYSFRTIGPIRKAYNYPNPFNPGMGESTGVVFTMAEQGDADIGVYTELGDACWQTTVTGLPPGVNEVRYSGRDSQGRIIYNGSYVCVIRKQYQNREEKELCRMLVVK